MGSLVEGIEEAHRGIRPQVPVSSLERSAALSARFGVEIWLKCEHLQPTGSFKIRGATNKIRLLAASSRRNGVVTASTGNHGRAVAHAGRAANVPVTVFAARSAPRHKLEAIRSLGAELVTVEGDPLEVEQCARAHAESVGLPYISPYNDVEVIAGQGTIGMELLEQLPDLDAIFVSVGGGGLIGGIGTALKHRRPRVRVVGVWPENSADLLKRLRPDQVVDATERPTLSDSTAGAIEPNSVTIGICDGVIDETLTVSEEEIADAMRQIAEAEHWITEGAAGVALAGVMKRAQAYRDRNVAVVLCGRNIALDTFLEAIGGAERRSTAHPRST
ncbi:MAG TPA: threonine/serine dehydratase [Steroidobacteraceae bacterium]|nr:threonine/serine dehydratase [Steroidobacteraceae bacterium]